MIGTRTRAGAVASNARAAPGTFTPFAIGTAPITTTSAPKTPSAVMRAKDFLNTLFASLNCPTAHLSATIFDVATGSPAVDMTSRIE